MMPVIGFLSSGSPGERAALLTAFRKGLSGLETEQVARQNGVVGAGAMVAC
jgi:hypothetical protein